MLITTENKRSICRVLAVTLLLLTTMGTQCRGDNQVNKEMDPEMEKVLQHLEKSISKEIITEGEYEALKIGQEKSTVISSLQDMGIEVVSPDVKDVITVTKASDLHKVKDAESVTLDGTKVFLRIAFKGDDVEKIDAPPHTVWEQKTKFITTREEVFKLLSEILHSDPKAYVRNLSVDPRSRGIRLKDLSGDDQKILMKYDAWKMNRDNDAGYWHFSLEFDNDILKTIIVQHSPVELP